MKKSMKLGGGGRFAKLKATIAKRGGVKNPAAVAAAIGRKKYGSKKMAHMAAKGKARHNPRPEVDGEEGKVKGDGKGLGHGY